MATNNYLAEVPATFIDLGRRFGSDHGNDVLESTAGKLATDVLTYLAQLVDSGQLTPGQLWSAIAAERGSVGACNMMANLGRAAQGQVIANRKPPIVIANVPNKDPEPDYRE